MPKAVRSGTLQNAIACGGLGSQPRACRITQQPVQAVQNQDAFARTSRNPAPSPGSAIGRVVIGMQRKQPQPWAIAPGHSSATSAHPQRIKPFSARPLAALDQLPAQAIAALELLPAHSLKHPQRFQNSPRLLFPQREQVGLKFRIVEIQLNHRTLQSMGAQVMLEGVKIRASRRLAHSGHGPIQPCGRLWLMQPKLGIGDGLGGFDHPDAGSRVVDQHGAAGELLA